MRSSGFVLHHALDVRAPATVVWSVITDLARYPEWNPFVVACTSTLAVGDPIDMRVRIFAWFVQPQRERVFEHVPGRRLCYGLPRLPLGALASSRSHGVEPAGPDATRYVSHFELSGWLAPLITWLLGPRLATGFESMATALARRAEGLAGATGAARADELRRS